MTKYKKQIMLISSFSQENLVAALRQLDQCLTKAASEMRPELDPFNGVRITFDQILTLLSDRSDNLVDYNTSFVNIWFPGELTEQWKLTSFDVAILLIALAPEIDSRYERVYAFLQDDITRTRPSVNLVLRLLCSSEEERVRRIEHFLPDSPLVRADLIRFDSKDTTPVAARILTVSDLILRLIVGDDVATMPPPFVEQRRIMWEEELIAVDISHETLCVEKLSTLLPLSRRDIRNAVVSIKKQYSMADKPGNEVFVKTAMQAYRSPSSLGRHVPIRRDWQDLVLNPYTMDHLRQLEAQIRVHSIARGKSQLAGSMAVLFTGPSGTGKTLAAEVLAGGLKMNLFRISASQIFDKYVGETEKNIDRMFELIVQNDTDTPAHTALLIDEAEWMFSKRVESRDAHDHYMNLRTGHLLQRLEAYQGVVILTSNLPNNIDSAFKRRWFQHVVFEMPDVSARCRLWNRILEQAGIEYESVNGSGFAHAFALSGASIRNVVVLALYDAIAASCELNDEILAKAVVREYRKQQHVLSVGEVLHLVNTAVEKNTLSAVSS